MTGFPERLVYVDDELDMRTIVRETLESQGFDGTFAACGSGKELMNRFTVLQPQLIMLDLKMPEMDGLDTIEALQEHADASGVPVIFITGATKVEMLEKYKKLGVIGVIHKPFDFESLMKQVTEIWNSYNDSEDDDEAEEG